MLTWDEVRERRRDRRREANRWRASVAIEREYAARLRVIARHIDTLIRAWAENQTLSGADMNVLIRQMNAYAAVLEPWARATADRMLAEINRRNRGVWMRQSRQIATGLRRDVYETPVGAVMRAALDRQVELITSLPREAAARIQRLAVGGYISGQRIGEIRTLGPQARGPLAQLPEGLVTEIMRTGEVTAARASLIARTETTRASTELTAARAQYAGSTHFVWRAVMDRDTRPMHRKLHGTIHRWDDPPVAEEDGTKHLPGAFPNCRCFASPILPDDN
jgi:SPP1 gp7 family putative phage head morphogenesis protein